MKNFIAFILCFLFLITPFSAFASEETVYATENVNIRTEPNTDCKIITVLKKGSSITRIGETEDGWSKVIYEGEQYYITSEYLSAEPPTEETPDETSQEPTETPTSEPTTEDNSTPRFMVTGYELSEKSLSPEKTAILKTIIRVMPL